MAAPVCGGAWATGEAVTRVAGVRSAPALGHAQRLEGEHPKPVDIEAERYWHLPHLTEMSVSGGGHARVAEFAGRICTQVGSCRRARGGRGGVAAEGSEATRVTVISETIVSVVVCPTPPAACNRK